MLLGIDGTFGSRLTVQADCRRFRATPAFASASHANDSSSAVSLVFTRIRNAYDTQLGHASVNIDDDGVRCERPSREFPHLRGEDKTRVESEKRGENEPGKSASTPLNGGNIYVVDFSFIY